MRLRVAAGVAEGLEERGTDNVGDERFVEVVVVVVVLVLLFEPFSERMIGGRKRVVISFAGDGILAKVGTFRKSFLVCFGVEANVYLAARS